MPHLFRLFAVAVLATAATGPLLAVARPEAAASLRDRSFRRPELFIPNVYRRPSEAPATASLADDLEALGVSPDRALLDVRSRRWGTLVLRQPLLPGGGSGNRLTWEGVGLSPPVAEKELRQAVWTLLRRFLVTHQAELRIDLSEVQPRIAVHDGGEIVQVHLSRTVGGIPVRNSSVKAAINHGNLVLLGTQNWGDVDARPAPTLPAEAALARVAAHLRPHAITGAWRATALSFVPLARGADLAAVEPGRGYAYRLVWVLSPKVDEDLGSWEALVDAHSGELLAFTDQNQYADRKMTGGIYPVSNDGQTPDGIEQPGFPMPRADVLQPFGTSFFSNGAGLVDDVGSSLRTTLAGELVRILDNCGAISEVNQCSNLDLGTGPGTDCDVPAGHSPGNTHSARSGFYEVNRLVETAQAWLPGNAWLQEQLTANMNIDDTCNAFWDGSTINFFKSGGPCANTGEIAAVFDHEWGHGLDDNGTDPSISAPGEAIADIYAIYRLAEHCMGRGFRPGIACGGYGDPCTACTGVRDLDFASHEGGEAHDLDWISSPTNDPPGDLVEGGCVGVVGTQQGPCGQETHCEGMVPAETGWDLQARDLRAAPFGYDANTALEIATRLVYLGADNIGDWYQCVPTPALQTAGCNADSGYLNLAAVDDDNGDLTDGTPHVEAIFNAFARHQIACAPPPVGIGPPVTNSGCTGAPALAPPNFSVTPLVQSAHLSWTAVAGASEYWIFRTEGVRGCDFGKVKIAETTSTNYTDTGLLDGFQYLYAVLAVGSHDSCMGPMSSCVAATPLPPGSPPAEALFAFREVANPFAILTGDGDVYLDNCELATFAFEVENAGSMNIEDVEVTITPLSHPGTEILTPLPIELGDVPGGACGSPSTIVPVTVKFRPQGMGFDEPLQLEIAVSGVAGGLPNPSLVGTFTLEGSESDFQFFTSKAWSFESGAAGDLQSWRIVSGTYAPASPGANGTLFHLASSALLAGQCDRIQSPEVKLTATSTLSLFNQFNTEPPSPLGTYDRANVGIFDRGSAARTTLVPTGGRLYNAAGPNGVCVTAGQAGWAGEGAFAQSTWSAAALNPGGQFTGLRTRIDVAYGTDPLVQGQGFQFDEVVITNAEVQVADGATNVCPALPNAVDDVYSVTIANAEDGVTLAVLSNDAGTGLQIQSVTQPANGTVTITQGAPDTLVYTYTGVSACPPAAIFQYTIVDANQLPATATVTVNLSRDLPFADGFESGDFAAWCMVAPG
jgi:hypothetical protein